MRLTSPHWVVILALGLFAAASVEADVANLSPLKDNTIYEPNAEISNGAGSYLFAGHTDSAEKRRALIAFDVSGSGLIPAGSTITSVTLTMRMSRTQAGSNGVSLRRLSADWGEGSSNASGQEGGGDSAENNDATWLYTFYNAGDPGSSPQWSSQGGDFVGTTSSSISVGGNGLYTWGSTAQMVADVQLWLDTPSSNFGWIVLGTESGTKTAKRFNSRQNGTDPPDLSVTFTPPAATGACCADNAGCTEVTSSACTGVFLGTSEVCSPNPCGAQTGACCSPVDGSCSQVLDPGSACSGNYQGNMTVCDPNTCPPPATGACCFADPSATCLVDTAPSCATAGGTYQGDLSVCTPNSCPVVLTPFMDALPIPAVATPVSGTSGGVATYDIAMREIQQQLHTQLANPTTLWGYGDGPTGATFPGPTIEATKDQQVTVNWINDLRDTSIVGDPLRTQHYLNVDTCPNGADDQSVRTVVHLHGGHVPEEFDGYPEDTFTPGLQDTYLYANNQLPSTLWFHDHALGITRLNVYMGLAALYLVRDAVELALNLPMGEFEIPVVIQDRTFNPDGSLQYPFAWQDTFFGDTILVNGKVWPFLNVKQGKYRFRLLNGSNSRTYVLSLSGGLASATTFTQIGAEGGLLSAPVSGLTSLTLGPAERADVIVDFELESASTEIVLTNSAPAPFPGSPGEGVIPNVLKFIVQATAGDTDAVPATLRTMEVLHETNAVEFRTFELAKGTEPCAGTIWEIVTTDGLNGASLGSLWDDITEFPELGTTEVWSFINRSGMTHPMHMHLVMFQVLDRQGFDVVAGNVVPIGSPVAPPPQEAGWKDTVQVGPSEIVRVIARFEDYTGQFAYHCHILEHEDHEMMRQFQTVQCGNTVVEPGEECDDGNPVDGDGCNTACELEDFLNLFGTAQGGTVQLSVDGVPLSVPTTLGQTAGQVATAVAAAINADPTLSASGVTASAQENTVVTNGTISAVAITDPGLTDAPAIPAMGPWGFAVLAGALLLAAAARQKRR